MPDRLMTEEELRCCNFTLEGYEDGVPVYRHYKQEMVLHGLPTYWEFRRFVAKHSYRLYHGFSRPVFLKKVEEYDEYLADHRPSSGSQRIKWTHCNEHVIRREIIKKYYREKAEVCNG